MTRPGRHGLLGSTSAHRLHSGTSIAVLPRSTVPAVQQLQLLQPTTLSMRSSQLAAGQRHHAVPSPARLVPAVQWAVRAADVQGRGRQVGGGLAAARGSACVADAGNAGSCAPARGFRQAGIAGRAGPGSARSLRGHRQSRRNGLTRPVCSCTPLVPFCVPHTTAPGRPLVRREQHLRRTRFAKAAGNICPNLFCTYKYYKSECQQISTIKGRATRCGWPPQEQRAGPTKSL